MFIVLEGLDGAGKSTQIDLLRSWLKGRGVESEYLHFPRFDAPVYGDLIARFLRGELGALGEVNPYLVAMLYAGDRDAAAPMLRGWLEQGKAILLDRYVYSNIGYQCAKVENEAKRAELRDWILDLEYNHFSTPRPDLSIFLDVPFAFTAAKLTAARDGDDRDYLKGKEDIHESSLTLQQRVRQVYLDAAEVDDSLCVVDCEGEGGVMAAPEVIFAKIKTLIESR